MKKNLLALLFVLGAVTVCNMTVAIGEVGDFAPMKYKNLEFNKNEGNPEADE